MTKPSAPLSGTFARTTVTTPPRVLIIGDSTDASEMYALYLRHADFRVAIARADRDPNAEAHSVLPDIVVMDLLLLGDALEATYRLQSDPDTWNIPVLVLTSLPVPAARSAARAAGASSVLPKPCLPQHLTAELRRMLALAHGDAPVVLTSRRRLA